MHIETPNREAFELVGDALVALDAFQQSKERAQLDQAVDHLNEALQKDPDYLRARYYTGVTHDLIGESSAAVKAFEEVLENVSEVDDPTFVAEVRYNLGTAHYHAYGEEHLANAEKHFKVVIDRAEEKTIRNLAEASLAQTYAQRMVHGRDIEAYATQAEEAAKEAIGDLWQRRLLSGLGFTSYSYAEQETLRIAYNARGLAAMFHADLREDKKYHPWRMKALEKAARHFRTALVYSPDNWALVSNLGSVHMRRGYWMKQRGESASSYAGAFDEARRHLQDVYDRLQPGYGFALYEIGRTYRLEGKFDDAISFFCRALAMPVDGRDVSDERLVRELQWAEKKDAILSDLEPPLDAAKKEKIRPFVEAYKARCAGIAGSQKTDSAS